MFIPTLNNPTTSKKTCPFRRTIRIFKPFPQLLHPQNDQSTTYFQKEKKRKHSYQIVYFSKISKPLYKLLSPESISIDNPSESFERKKNRVSRVSRITLYIHRVSFVRGPIECEWASQGREYPWRWPGLFPVTRWIGEERRGATVKSKLSEPPL